MKIKSIFSIALCCLFVLGASNAMGQSQSQTTMKKQRQLTLGPVVNAASQVSMNDIDHAAWNTLLKKYVDDAGGVNYAGLKASQQDSAALDQYISTLSTASFKRPASTANQMAFWINLQRRYR